LGLSTNAVMLSLVVALGTWDVGPARSAEITVFQQTNVIQPVAGTEYLGPLPPELMEYGRVGVGLLTASKHREVANAFIKFMTDPANAALLRKGDMEAPLR
jgi:ABC-type molybdate transport system substrate-binding protein